MSDKQKLQAPRHARATSLDTNASGIAESTISLGLSRFPEPPSSIPPSLLSSNSNAPSPTRSAFSQTTPTSANPSRKPPRPERPAHPPSVPLRFPNSRHSSKPSGSGSDIPQSSSSSRIISPYDWHDGASSIDVDATEERLLPTSFITSLLQENKDLRKANRSSYASDALSGISEMTYPPLMNWAGNRNMAPGPYASARMPAHQQSPESRTPPNSHHQPTIASNRMSGDSETLHSLQGYPSIIRTPNVSRTGSVPGTTVVGVAPDVVRSISASSQTSSIQDSDTIGSITKGYQSKLAPTYESGEELLVDYQKFNSTYGPALPSTAGTQRRFLRDSPQQDPFLRNSIHSQQSAAPSFISRISKLSRKPFLGWRKIKPLPPVPTIPDIPIAAENAHRKEEESTPLPDLVNRAGVLRDLLDRGQHPHHSMHSYQGIEDDPFQAHGTTNSGARKREYSSDGTGTLKHLSPLHKASSSAQHIVNAGALTRRKRWFILVIFLIIVAAAIGAGIGITVGRKKGAHVTCSGNFTGSTCNLDATCVCTSTSGCNGLAQSIINLLPIVNQQFSANFTSASAYTSVWMMQGSPTAGSCASQALLMDVGTGLDQTTYPNRTQWTQSALLWNALQTQDSVSSQVMQKFVQGLPWENLDGADGIVTADARFSTTVSGYTYDFASQSVVQPPASFVTLGQPSNDQISRVSSGASATLDRMYTYAQASATQRQNALKKYWTSVLSQQASDLPTFKTALSVLPIMLPFNASSPSVRGLYATSPTGSFPPPLSCFPQLNNNLWGQINTFESSVFGLPAAANASQFNTTCYPERPIYGVLNVLGLRLPTVDSDLGTDKQGIILNRAAISRALLYNGPIFSAVNGTAPTTIASSQMDPRQFGTLVLSDHVILQYLSSIPNITIANALIQFVLHTTLQTAVPPVPTSLLYSSLDSLPVLEVAIFGSILPSGDMQSTVSPFTNPSGSLFFGSDNGSALRNWTINSISGGSVAWTQNATSPLVVHDNNLGNTTITQTWNGAALAIATNQTSINLQFITSVLQGTLNFSP